MSASTINVKFAAVRKLVGEIRRAGVITAEESSQMSDIPNVRQNGVRLGNWLTKERAGALLAVPNRAILKGKRDYAILALLVGCALRRRDWRRSLSRTSRYARTAGSSPTSHINSTLWRHSASNRRDE